MEQYIVTGMSCAACQARVEKAVSKVPGVTSCSVSLLTNSMGVEGDADASQVIRAVTDAGYGASLKGASGGTGKESAASGEASDPGKDGAQYSSGYEAEEEALKDRETPKLKRRLILSVGFLVVLMYVSMGHHMLSLPLPAYFEQNYLGLTLLQMILAAIVLLINKKFFTSGYRSLFHGAPNMDTLVALGSSVSFCWSTYVFFKLCGMAVSAAPSVTMMEVYHNQLYYEASAMIPALITVGKMLEAMSKGRTTDALKSLMRLAPKTAVLLRDGEEVEVGIDEVRKGDIFVVRPGGSVPVDGVILSGNSAVNESALTGESVPADKMPGDIVNAATINQSGYLTCRAERVGRDTALSRIIQMVSDAAATKAPIARIADKVSGVFVPAVIGIAVVVIIGWLLAGQTVSFALARAISVLVISCPCALGLATPVAIMVGNGLAAKNGILFKTSEALEETGRIGIVALDKTGTITEGKPEATDILPAEGCTTEELLYKAWLIEQKSEHPLSKAVTAAYSVLPAGLPSMEVTDFQALPGNGLTATVRECRGMADNASAVKCGEGESSISLRNNSETEERKEAGKRRTRKLHAGSGKFIRSIAAVPDDLAVKEAELAASGKTPLFFAEDGNLLGIIAVADVIKKDSKEAVGQLKKMGLEVVMLTGDNEKTAAAIGKEAGVDRVIAGVLPDGKEAVIRNLQERGKVAMVGDGINDAPALTRADIGIAIGAGTDVAIDSADIVLMNSTISDVAAAIRISRATLRDIHQNLFWAFIYNLICIPLAAGLFVWEMNPMIGAAAMSLSSFTVCMNALRLNLFKPHDPSHDKPSGSRQKRKNAILSAGNSQPGPGAAADKMPENAGTANSQSEEETGTNHIETKERKKQMEKTVKIEGMMCPHCEANVKKAMEALEQVESALVSHEAGTAVLTLSADVDDEILKKTVEEKGYTFLGVE